jgi:hypothetical protein
MTEPKTETVTIQPDTPVRLSGLSAPVTVIPGSPGEITITIKGDTDYQKAVTVTHGRAVEIVEKDGGSNSITVNGGSVIIGGDNSGVVIGSSGTVMTNTFGRGSYRTVVSGNVGGRVIVNGVDVTDVVNERRATTPPSPNRAVTITIPPGTDIAIERCAKTNISGIKGRIRASIRSQSSLTVDDATGLRAKISGQSTVSVRGTGPADLDVSGQSTVRLRGDFQDVELDISGQSTVSGSGTFRTVTGEASGMSRVDFSGAAETTNVTTFGMSTATLNGRPMTTARRARTDWDF